MDFLPESESTTPLLSNDFSPLQCTYFGPQLNLPNLQQFTIIAIIPIITTLVLNHHDCCHHCHSYHYHHSVTIESLSFLCFSMSLLFAGMFLFMFPSALTKLKKKNTGSKTGSLQQRSQPTTTWRRLIRHHCHLHRELHDLKYHGNHEESLNTFIWIVLSYFVSGHTIHIISYDHVISHSIKLILYHDIISHHIISFHILSCTIQMYVVKQMYIQGLPEYV